MKEDLLRLEIRRRLETDQRNDLFRGVAHYVAQWPDAADIVADEFDRFVSADSDRTRRGGDKTVVAPLIPETDHPPTPPAMTIDHYRVVREIGRGGQGIVYEAEDTVLWRRVAIKVLSTAGVLSEDALQRFNRESGIASKLDHPSLCTVYATGRFGGAPYIAMRYVDGQSLGVLIRTRKTAREGGEPIVLFDKGDASDADSSSFSRRSADRVKKSIRETIRIFEATARGLHVAHESGIVHRDIKPANIMITKSQDPVILDFGLARDTTDDTENLTRTGDIFGTPSYLAPEQLTRKGASIDRRADVYALGVSLYQALAFELPFREPTIDALYHAVLTKSPTPLRRLNPDVPSDLEVVVEVAMERDLARRYQSADALAEDLARIAAGEPIAARPMSAPMRFFKWMNREPAKAAALLLAILLTVLLTIAAVAWRDVRRERDASVARERTEEKKRRVENLLEEGFALYESSYLAVARERRTGPLPKARAKELSRPFRDALALDAESFEAAIGASIMLANAGYDDDAVAVASGFENSPSRRPAVEFLKQRLLSKERNDSETRLAKSLDPSTVDPAFAFLIGIDEIERHHAGLGSSVAVEWLLRAALTSPHPRALYVNQLGHAITHAGRVDLAPTIADIIVSLGSDRASSWYWAGMTLFVADSPRALTAFDRCLEIDPGHIDALKNRGMLFMSEERYAEATADLIRAAKLDPDDPASKIRLANVKENSLEHAEALALADEVLSVRPDAIEAVVVRAAALIGLGRLAEAESELQKVLEASPRNVEALLQQALLFESRGRFDDAVATLDAAIAIAPNDYRLHMTRGGILGVKGLYGEAIKAFEATINKNPRSSGAWLNLGHAYFLDRNFSASITTLTEGRKRFPGDAQIAINLSNALEAAGRVDDAVATLNDVVRSTGDFLAAYNLGVLLAKLERYDESLAAYRFSDERRPNRGETLCNIGSVLESLGRFDEALEFTRRGHEAGRLSPNWNYPSESWIVRRKALVEDAARLDRWIGSDKKALAAEDFRKFLDIARRRRDHRVELLLLEHVMSLPNPDDAATATVFISAASATATLAEKCTDPAERSIMEAKCLDHLERQLKEWDRLAEKDFVLPRESVAGTRKAIETAELQRILSPPDSAPNERRERCARLAKKLTETFAEIVP